jgi:hypothetical protein
VGVRDLGVWQSPQPAAIVRYLPRSTWESSDFWEEQPAMHSITVSNRKRETPNSVVCCRSTSALLLKVGIVNEEVGGNCPLLPDYITREGCWGGDIIIDSVLGPNALEDSPALACVSELDPYA